VERGERNISLASIVRLVGALGVTLAEFFHAFEEQFLARLPTSPAIAANESPRAKSPKRKPARKPE
jgi:hypothetical protein